MEDHHPRE